MNQHHNLVTSCLCWRGLFECGYL